ncbi:site-specific integrase [Mangrovicoccus sp. HB161399]|uniref:tyrosine-type recombinase/integrase n=1 Tax=Mangrovicoccus sp. HB161399 TaxID=2720392 RepID=UPI00155813D5|nr:site-specific integrase [Mangrovicoccus sp. HB161399]
MYAVKWDAPGSPHAIALACDWLQFRSDLEAADNTVQSYCYDLQDYFRFCHRAGIDPRDAKPVDIRAYVRHLAEHRYRTKGQRTPATPLSKATKRRRLNTVKIFYDFLEHELDGFKNPVALPSGSTRPRRTAGIKHSKTDIILPSAQDFERFMRCAAEDTLRNRLMVALALDCALRREELTTLETKDIDEKKMSVTIHAEKSKSLFTRTVPFSPIVLSLYRQYRQQRKKDGLDGESFILLSDSNRNFGKPISKWAWNKVVEKLREAVGSDAIATHVFRHMSLTGLAAAGVPASLLAKFAGHSHISSTAPYIHLSGRDFGSNFRSAMQKAREKQLGHLTEKKK